MSIGSSDEPRVEPRIPRGDDFLSREEAARLTSAELTRRIQALSPFVAEHTSETERLRRPVDAVWSALRKSGYFYQFVPKAFGGIGADLDGFIDATLPLSEACASTAWVASFCAKHNWILAQFPIETQRDLWDGDFPYIIAPAVGSPTGKAIRVDGGVRVSGRWKYASGVMHADWIMVVALLSDGDDAPVPIGVLFPAAQAEVIDTWHMDGMAGTGSHDVQVMDLFVPDKRTVPFADIMAGKGMGAQIYPGSLFSAPMVPLFSATAAIPALGAAKAALRHFAEQIASRKTFGSNLVQGEMPATQIRLGEAHIAIHTAEMIIRHVGRLLPGLSAMAPDQQTAMRIAIRAKVAHAVSLCRKAVLSLGEVAGTSSYATEHPFGRALRDISIIASHPAFDGDSAFELHGRVMLGHPPHSPAF